MQPNHSPWIHQLKRTRPVNPLSTHIKTDIAIIGAGIAGIATAYYILRDTKKSIALIEGNKVAHGATGHNAGQLASFFERQLINLVQEFGLDQTADAQAAIDSAWILLEGMIHDAGLKTPLYQFTGYAGIASIEKVLVHLSNSLIAKEAGIKAEPIMVAEESDMAQQIPKQFAGLYTLVPHKNILSLLETQDKRYCALVSSRGGAINGALLCEEIAGYLLSQFPDRFTLVEQTFVDTITLHNHEADISTKVGHGIKAERVVLCTNGFQNFIIVNKSGQEINTRFHHMVDGKIGYMAGFLEEMARPPMGNSFLLDRATGPHIERNPYFYMTRRPYEGMSPDAVNLISVGGPESVMDDVSQYSSEHPYPAEAQKSIDEFVHQTYQHAPHGDIDYKFKWHGLMGYTKNGVRLIGEEPFNRVLLYNLGCNGVGILPSIYGGQKISWIIQGKKLPPSIFDPHTA